MPTPAVVGARGSGAHGTSGGHGISGSSRIAMPFVPPPAQVEPPGDGETPDGDAPALDWMDEVESTQEGTPSQGHDTDRMRARDVQKGMLTDAPVIEGFGFATRFEACHDISGDFYEFISLPDGRIGFAQGDVSGHGMHAGLIMSMAKKTLAIFAEAGNSPTDTLSKVNDSLASDLGGKIFISMVYAILDPHDRTITWGRAGHNPIIRFNINTGTLTEIKPKGMVVGMKAGQLFRRASENEVTQVDSGDVFLIYTDGITETMNRQQVEFGTDLLNEVIRKHAAAGPELLLDRIMESVRQFRGGTSVEDDLTLLVLAVE
ncbi:MAG: serine/threonine-protein phosphatase [Planctomycetes bacterium]|nr:serine/threonine-protein phosphatase [Planctomycetota bacterium]